MKPAKRACACSAVAPGSSQPAKGRQAERQQAVNAARQAAGGNRQEANWRTRVEMGMKRQTRQAAGSSSSRKVVERQRRNQQRNRQAAGGTAGR